MRPQRALLSPCWHSNQRPQRTGLLQRGGVTARGWTHRERVGRGDLLERVLCALRSLSLRSPSCAKKLRDNTNKPYFVC